MATLTQTEQDFTRLPDLPAEVFTAPLKKPAHVGDDWLEPKQTDYTAEDDAIWNDLFARQMAVLPGRAATAFMAGLEKLNLDRGGVPEFGTLSEDLDTLTGWSVVPVPMLIPDHVFFWHLANRRFPAGNFIRTRETFDYIQEPDVFHDVFGHVPMLTDPVYADYMQEYGRAGWKAMRYNRLKALGSLYWYTVEFGLVEEAGGLRIYGSGIVSSHGESLFSLDDPSPNRIGFDMKRVMRTNYRIDDFQQVYFVIPSFEELLRQTVETDFAPLYRELESASDFAPDDIVEGDRIFTRGTQAYAREQAASPA